jgi:hypothetical protein
VLIDSAEDPVPPIANCTAVGLNRTAPQVGTRAALNATFPGRVPTPAICTVTCPVPPEVSDNVAGESDIEKSKAWISSASASLTYRIEIGRHVSAVGSIAPGTGSAAAQLDRPMGVSIAGSLKRRYNTKGTG